MKKLHIYFILLIGCASVQQPTGGEKDETPPKVLTSSTDSAALNISTSTFSFTFDEYIQLKQAVEKLIISPTQSKPPTISAKKKKLTILLNDSLLKNTTYTFQFNGAVADINEGNPLDNYSFIFSSGNYIDSSSYRGSVINYTTKDTCVDCNIYLYKTYSDTTLINTKPAYLARTDNSGKFIFNNLPNQQFTAIALQDKNKNLFFNKDEMVSLPKTIHTDSNAVDTFYTFQNQNTDKHTYKFVKSAIPGTFMFYANRPFERDSTIILFEKDTIPFVLSFSKDTLITYYAQTVDTIHITLLHKSDTAKFQNTVNLDEQKYKLISKLHGNPTLLTVSFKIPIHSIDTSKVLLVLDSIPIPFQIKRTDTTNFSITLSKPYKQAEIILIPDAFTDFYGISTVTDTLRYNNREEEPTNLVLDLRGTPGEHYILYIKQGDKIIKQLYLTENKKLVFNDLKPNKYRVHVLTDSNKNGVWDTGNVFKLQAPEPVTVSEEIELRQNWDEELIINIL